MAIYVGLRIGGSALPANFKLVQAKKSAVKIPFDHFIACVAGDERLGTPSGAECSALTLPRSAAARVADCRDRRTTARAAPSPPVPISPSPGHIPGYGRAARAVR